MTTLSSRDFNQDTARAKREAQDGPVFVTDRGTPTHVLLTVAEYERLAARKQSIVDLLYDPSSAHIDLPIPDRSKEVSRAIDFGE